MHTGWVKKNTRNLYLQADDRRCKSKSIIIDNSFSVLFFMPRASFSSHVRACCQAQSIIFMREERRREQVLQRELPSSLNESLITYAVALRSVALLRGMLLGLLAAASSLPLLLCGMLLLLLVLLVVPASASPSPVAVAIEYLFLRECLMSSYFSSIKHYGDHKSVILRLHIPERTFIASNNIVNWSRRINGPWPLGMVTKAIGWQMIS